MTKFRCANHFFSILKPKPQLTISQWADQYRFIARGTGPEAGQWRTSRAPYSREIMDIFNTDVQMVVFMASSQVGKTEIALNLMGFFIDQDPSPQMYLLPTDGIAEDFSKTRIQKNIDDTPVLAKLFSSKSRDGDNTIGLKNFAGGFVTIHGANTPTKLASKPIRILIADEIDRFPGELAKEGNPVKLAIQRTTNYSNRKIILISTPTVKGASQIESWFLKSDQRYYHVPCPDCEHKFVLNWNMVEWEKDENDELIESSVHIKCPACSFEIRDRHKSYILENGEWIALAPRKKIPGFHISTLYSPWVKFRELVAEYLEAKREKDRKKLKEFYNLKLGLPFEEDYSEIEVGELESHREDYPAQLPDKVLILTCAVDVQDDRVEFKFVGWGMGEEAWVIKYYALSGDLTSDSFWNEIDMHISQGFSYADGNILIPACTTIDSGGHFTQEVYKFVKPRKNRGVFSIKGAANRLGIPVISKPSKVGRKKDVLNFIVGVDNAKDILHYRLKNHHKGPGYIHFPRDPDAGCDQKYFEMLLSEHKVEKRVNGRTRMAWEKIYPSARNESLDLFVYNIAAVKILNPPFDVLAVANNKRIAESGNSQSGETKAANVQPLVNRVRKPRRRRILSTGIDRE